MSEIRVWAPAARQVELVSGNLRLSMPSGEGGWRVLDAATLGPGSDYAFSLDGSGPLPDPRSPFQPLGVHGPSRLVDHGGFSWTDADWTAPPLADGLVYELHVGTFTPEGTFDAATTRLQHLVDLGVTHVELMPVAEFSGDRGWGYDAVDLYAPHHAYGGPEGLKRLVDACHARGLAVLLDVVYNHLGPDGNYLSRFGPYFTQRYATPWGPAVNFDGPGSDGVRRFLCDNALMWLRDYHCDGLRIDAVHAILDTSALHFIEHLVEEVETLQGRLGRRLVLVAESDLNDPRTIRDRAVGGHGMDAQWNEDFHHALQAVLAGERHGYYVDFGTLGDVAKALVEGFVYDGRFSAYRGRRHGRAARGISGHRFVGFLQNHDQVGNHAGGRRLSQEIPTERLEVGAALLFTAPFVPMLFMGEEWGASTPFLYFTSYQDAELGRAVREGRHSEFAAFGWAPADIPDPQAAETFTRSRLDWAEPEREPHARLLRWHRALAALRRHAPELRDGRCEAARVTFDEAGGWIHVERDRITLACNLGSRLAVIPLARNRPHEPLLVSSRDCEIGSDELRLPPNSVVVLGPQALQSPTSVLAAQHYQGAGFDP